MGMPMANETTVPMRKAEKGKNDSTESKGGHEVNKGPWIPHTTKIEPIETNTRILLSREAITSQDSRPLPRKARSIDFQKWVKILMKMETHSNTWLALRGRASS